MTYDDDAWYKDSAIQKEMEFRIKPVFRCFESLLDNFIERKVMSGTCIKMSGIYCFINRQKNRVAHTCIVFCFKKPKIITFGFS